MAVKMDITLTDQNFDTEVFASTEPVLIDFYADWCMPCKMLAPTIDEISREVKGVKVYKVNVDQQPKLAQRFQILTIPTLMVVKDGEIQQTVMGVYPKQKILNMLGV